MRVEGFKEPRLEQREFRGVMVGFAAAEGRAFDSCGSAEEKTFTSWQQVQVKRVDNVNLCFSTVVKAMVSVKVAARRRQRVGEEMGR